ncbi:MAG: hypothetical protein ACRCT1_06245 [Microcoleaceae cyanobacterium]|jgi:hypothetical protein
MSGNNLPLFSLVKLPQIILFAKLQALIIALTQIQDEAQDWDNIKVGLNDVDD